MTLFYQILRNHIVWHLIVHIKWYPPSFFKLWLVGWKVISFGILSFLAYNTCLGLYIFLFAVHVFVLYFCSGEKRSIMRFSYLFQQLFSILFYYIFRKSHSLSIYYFVFRRVNQITMNLHSKLGAPIVTFTNFNK